MYSQIITGTLYIFKAITRNMEIIKKTYLILFFPHLSDFIFNENNGKGETSIREWIIVTIISAFKLRTRKKAVKSYLLNKIGSQAKKMALAGVGNPINSVA